MDPFLIVIGVVIVLAIILLIVGMSGKSESEELIEDRIVDEGGRRKRQRKDEEEDPNAAYRPRNSPVSAAIDRAVADRSFAHNLATKLAQANMKWTVGEYLFLQFFIAVILSLLLYATEYYAAIPIAVLLGFFGPRIFLSMKKSQRLKAFNDQLGDSLNLIVNSLQAGYSTMQALEVVAKEMPQPIAEEFGRVIFELQLGVTFDIAMANLLRRMPSTDMDLVITAMSVQREVGGNLAEVLDAISFTIRERVRIKGEINTLTSQGRITGYVITFLPFALAILIYFVNPDFMGLMFEEACGWIMMGIALFMIVIGYISINKIVSIEI